MKFTYNSALNLVLSGLKVSALAVAMVAIVACGSSGKKDDNKKSSSDKKDDAYLYTVVVQNKGIADLMGCKVVFHDTTNGGLSAPISNSDDKNNILPIKVGSSDSFKFSKEALNDLDDSQNHHQTLNEGDAIELTVNCDNGITETKQDTYKKGGTLNIEFKPASGTAIMISNDGATNANGKAKITSCAIDGVTVNVAKKEEWTGSIDVATSKFVSGAMVCKDDSNTDEYHAWYHYSENGQCSDADRDNGDCKKGVTMYHHSFSIDKDSSKWGQAMQTIMAIDVWSAKDFTGVTCNIKGTDIAFKNPQYNGEDGWTDSLAVPAGTFNYGDKVDAKCSNGKEIHVYAKSKVEDEVDWE